MASKQIMHLGYNVNPNLILGNNIAYSYLILSKPLTEPIPISLVMVKVLFVSSY